MLRWRGGMTTSIYWDVSFIIWTVCCGTVSAWLLAGPRVGDRAVIALSFCVVTWLDSYISSSRGQRHAANTGDTIQRYSDTLLQPGYMRTAGLWPRSPAAAVLAPLAPMSRLTRHHNTDRRQSGSVTPMVVCTPAPCLRHGTGSDRVWVDIFRSFVQLVINTDTELWNNWHRQPAAWHNLLSLKWMEGLSIENEF